MTWSRMSSEWICQYRRQEGIESVDGIKLPEAIESLHCTHFSPVVTDVFCVSPGFGVLEVVAGAVLKRLM